VKNDFDNKENLHITPNQLRWGALSEPKEEKNWVEGLITFGGAGDPSTKNGMAIYGYACNKSMGNNVF